MKTKLLFVVFLILLPQKIYFAQWINPQSIQTTVLIENESLKPHGTGFLLYDYNNSGSFIVVTCSHLIRKHKQFFVRVNADSAIIKYFKEKNTPSIIFEKEKSIVSQGNVIFIVDLYNVDGSKLFVQDTTLDIAAFYLRNFQVEEKIDTLKSVYKVTNMLGIPKSQYSYRKDLSLGDEVYFIGFPFGIGTAMLVEPLIRSGSIAWLSKNSNEYLLDAFSFGGNSGSPIFQKIILGAKPGSLEWTPPKLVGMITGHYGLTLDNILTQPNPMELKFEKDSVNLNFGLARCVYVDDILKLVNKLKFEK